ncbi:MAG: YbjN domain-containing protein [Rhodobacteraceae bacterium]|nr:YbjN domain-containing protein [Paracoccaceae bacterium]
MERPGFDSTETYGHPVDLAERVAEDMGWRHSRHCDDELLIRFEGAWRQYTILFNWHQTMELFTVGVGFDMKLRGRDTKALLEVINLAGQRCPMGAFVLHADSDAIVFHCGQSLAGGSQLSAGQIRHMVEVSISQCENYYPALQIAASEGAQAEAAIEAAILEPVGSC